LVPPLLAVLALAAGVLERRGAGAASEARLALGPGGLTIERGAGRTRLDRERVVRWYALPEGVVLEATAPGGPRRLLLAVPDATLAPEERSGLRETCEALFGAPTTPPARHRWLRIALVPALLIELAMLAFNYSVGAP
ncbi:MAG TPA: hypothetical protein RMH80_25835, partial [Polyangiaceae bacterium LLY-WYZ-15_(1-7)]|nr:hypothetical protein [Polyangiaceae bacterium LLY-WYZ-15_(1-7)]